MALNYLLLLFLTFHLTSTADVDLATFSCSPTPLTLTGSENLIITNTTSSCKWKLVLTGNQRVKIQSTKLCLSCFEQLYFEDSVSGNVVWDVNTVHQQIGGSGKVCTEQSIYCGIAQAKELFVDSGSIYLGYERDPSTSQKVDIQFELTACE